MLLCFDLVLSYLFCDRFTRGWAKMAASPEGAGCRVVSRASETGIPYPALLPTATGSHPSDTCLGDHPTSCWLTCRTRGVLPASIRGGGPDAKRWGGHGMQRQRPPPVAEAGSCCWGRGQRDASEARRLLGAATRAGLAGKSSRRCGPHNAAIPQEIELSRGKVPRRFALFFVESANSARRREVLQ